MATVFGLASEAFARVTMRTPSAKTTSTSFGSALAGSEKMRLKEP